MIYILLRLAILFCYSENRILSIIRHETIYSISNSSKSIQVQQLVKIFTHWDLILFIFNRLELIIIVIFNKIVTLTPSEFRGGQTLFNHIKIIKRSSSRLQNVICFVKTSGKCRFLKALKHWKLIYNTGLTYMKLQNKLYSKPTECSWQKATVSQKKYPPPSCRVTHKGRDFRNDCTELKFSFSINPCESLQLQNWLFHYREFKNH